MRKKNVLRYVLICLLLGVAMAVALFCIHPSTKRFTPKHSVSQVRLNNAACLRCHGTWSYEMTKPGDTQTVIWKKMPKEYIIDTLRYYTSSHWNFSCTDCHSESYKQAPHDPNLRFEQMATCMDCHDESSDSIGALCRFSRIEADYNKSIHAVKRGKHFTCYTCHNPHSTRLCLRNDSMPADQVIEESNLLCTRCHATDREGFVAAHSFLPHLDFHLQKTRCIECHGTVNDSCLIAHNMPDGAHSVRNCSVCHSTGSKLKREFLDKRNTLHAAAGGKCCTRKMETTTMVGAYHNNIITICIAVVFGAILLFIVGHIVWSLRKKKT